MENQKNNYNKRWLITVFPIVVMMTIGVYVVFRLGTVMSSLNQATTIQKVSIVGFAIAEAFILIHGAGYLSNILLAGRKYNRGKINFSPKDFPLVDVVIPAHNEERSVLERTITAATYIDYPNYKIYVLNNCDDPAYDKSTREVCKELGVNCFIVPFPRHGAKAGSVNEYLKTTKAKYLAVFDADYRASRDFLKLLVPQLEESPRTSFIQTPQFYANINDSIITKGAQMQQSIFYEYICEGKSIKNAIFMCGTNLLIRVEALRSVGGFDESSITEDFSTSLRLAHRGWSAKYYNYTTAFGDGPVDLATFFKQQYRWARGTTGVFFKNASRLLLGSTKLTLSQRIEYILSGTYYISGFAWTVFMASPILYIFFGMPAYFANAWFYILAYYPYFMFSTILFFQAIRTRNYYIKDIFRSQSLAYICAPVYMRASLDAMLNKPAAFIKTNKSTKRSKNGKPINALDLRLVIPQLVLISLSMVAIVVGFLKIYYNMYSIALIINIFWAAFHVFILSYILVKIEYEQSSAASRVLGRNVSRPARI